MLRGASAYQLMTTNLAPYFSWFAYLPDSSYPFDMYSTWMEPQPTEILLCDEIKIFNSQLLYLLYRDWKATFYVSVPARRVLFPIQRSQT